MAKIIGSAPILLVTDVVASANHYRDQLGFKYDRFWGDPPGFCILRRDNFHLMLSRADAKHVTPHWKVVHDGTTVAGNSAFRIWTDTTSHSDRTWRTKQGGENESDVGEGY